MRRRTFALGAGLPFLPRLCRYAFSQDVPDEAQQAREANPGNRRILIDVPEANSPRLQNPPRRPGLANFADGAAELFEAIKTNDPNRGRPLFISRDVFAAVKGISDPHTLYDRIVRLFERDVAELHESLGEDAASATFDRFEFSRRRSWVEIREESNRLPYWAQRHNWIYYRVGETERRFEVRTMISWGEEWFITHLSEFRR